MTTTNYPLPPNATAAWWPSKSHRSAQSSGSQLSPDVARRDSRAPLNLALILDRSGSMQGDKLRYVQQAACHVLGHARRARSDCGGGLR